MCSPQKTTMNTGRWCERPKAHLLFRSDYCVLCRHLHWSVSFTRPLLQPRPQPRPRTWHSCDAAGVNCGGFPAHVALANITRYEHKRAYIDGQRVLAANYSNALVDCRNYALLFSSFSTFSNSLMCYILQVTSTNTCRRTWKAR